MSKKIERIEKKIKDCPLSLIGCSIKGKLVTNDGTIGLNHRSMNKHGYNNRIKFYNSNTKAFVYEVYFKKEQFNIDIMLNLKDSIQFIIDGGR